MIFSVIFVTQSGRQISPYPVTDFFPFDQTPQIRNKKRKSHHSPSVRPSPFFTFNSFVFPRGTQSEGRGNREVKYFSHPHSSVYPFFFLSSLPFIFATRLARKRNIRDRFLFPPEMTDETRLSGKLTPQTKIRSSVTKVSTNCRVISSLCAQVSAFLLRPQC